MEETLPDTWQDASDIAQLLGIETRKEYREYVRNNPDTILPLSPSSKYEDFPNWSIFLGKRDPSNYYETWQEAAEAAK